MIDIKSTWVGGIEGAIRGMRNPYESHGKSDSMICSECPNANKEGICINPKTGTVCQGFFMGYNDMTLCKKLIKAGSEHRKFLRMIHVQADVLAPRYWWAEMDKYKYVEANSSSTMHLITKRHVTADDFSIDDKENPSYAMKEAIRHINTMIDECNDDRWNAEQKKTFFMGIKEMLPESYNQLRTIDTNYECLLSIYHQRHAHNLPEWHKFCDWIGGLPYMGDFLEAME